MEDMEMDEYYNFVEYEHEEVNLFDQCPSQVFKGTFSSIRPLIIVTLINKLIKHTHFTEDMRLIINIALTNWLFGFFSLNSYTTMLIFNSMSLLAIVLIFHERVTGSVILAINICFCVIIQLTTTDEYFMSARGLLMLHNMKLAELAYEMQEIQERDRTRYLKKGVAYLYFAPTTIFGPFIKMDTFSKMWDSPLRGRLEESKYAVKSLFYINAGMIAVIISACFSSMIPIPHWIVRDGVTAFSFRTGHYFVSLVAQSTTMFMGEHVNIVQPFDVEVPRSVVGIVSNWNIPMHTFLHEHIFRPLYAQQYAFRAVTMTFIISSLLHGIDMQMSLTLLALGFIAYCETLIRKRLSAVLSCCVKSKKCSPGCEHTRKENSLLAMLINLIFALLAVYHLIFTGMPFTDDHAMRGYPVLHTFKSWKSHYFGSFLISIVLFLASKVI